MDRELLLAVLVAALCGPLVWLFSIWPARSRSGEAGRDHNDERRCWLELVRPIVPGAVVFAALLGWACSEPADAESAKFLSVALVPFGFVWMRALVRAVRSAFAPSSRHAAATVGLLRPRVVLRDGLADLLDPNALAAAKAHEEAHVRHHDPLRILCAQIITDLQWPLPVAERRFRFWLHALEIARDDEAVTMGVDRLDLAKAIVTCAAEGRHSKAAIASVVGEASLLPTRIRRLLDGPARQSAADSRANLVPMLAVVLVSAFVVGAFFGEPIVGALLRVLV